MAGTSPAMTALPISSPKPYLITPISRKYFNTPGWISSWLGAAAIVFAAVVSQACASFLHNALSAPCSARASR